MLAPADFRGFLNGAALDRRRTGRHADDDLGLREDRAAVIDLGDEVLDHLLGDFEVGDHAVPQGPDRLDVAGGAPQHHLRFVADGEDMFLAAGIGDRHHRRLVEHDASTLHVDQRIRGPEVDGHIGGHHAEQSGQH